MAQRKAKANHRKPPRGIPRGLGKPAVYDDIARLDDPERGPDFFEELALAARDDPTVYARFFEFVPPKRSKKRPALDVAHVLVEKALFLNYLSADLDGGLKQRLAEDHRRPPAYLKGEDAARAQAAAGAQLRELEAEEEVKRIRQTLFVSRMLFPLTAEEEQAYNDLRWLDFAIIGSKETGYWEWLNEARDKFYDAHGRTVTLTSSRIRREVDAIMRRERRRVRKEADQYWKELGRLPNLDPRGQMQSVAELRRGYREIREGKRGPRKHRRMKRDE